MAGSPNIYAGLPTSGGGTYAPTPAAPVPSAPTGSGIYASLPLPNAPKSSTPNPIPPSLYDQVNPPPTPQAGVVKSAMQAAYNAFINTPKVQQTPVENGGAAINETVSTAKNAFQQGVDALSAQVPQGNAIQRGAFIGDAAVKTIGATFGVLLAPMQGLATVPGVGNFVDGINAIFGAIGSGAGAGAASVVAQSPLSQKTKDAITPFVSDTASLVAQMYAGKIANDAVGDTFSKITDNSKAIMQELQNDPAIQESIAKQSAPPVKVPVKSETPNEATPVPISSQYTPDEKLPTIQMGAKPQPTIPTIQTEAPSDLPAPAGMKIVPDTQSNPETPTETAPGAAETPKTAETTSENAAAPQKTGAVTKAASDINATIVKQGYDSLTPDLQSKYTPESYKTELEKSTDLTANDYEDAVDRATGKKPVGNYEGQILFNEVERVATAKGDYQTLKDLAKSPLGKKLSVAGQTMGAHGFNDNPLSPVDRINQVEAARAAALKAKGTDVVKETAKDADTIKKTVKAARAPRQSWEDFAQNILTCKV